MIYVPPRSAAPRSDDTFELPVDGATVLVSTGMTSGSSAVIYFGGNGEDVAESVPDLKRAYPAAALFAMHYRGYNGSTGSPSEAALIADALILYDRVSATHANIVMIGRSLGSGVAIHIASMRRVNRLILVTPYDSLLELAARRFPLFPVRWLLLDKFESWRYAEHISVPTLLLAAEFDELIPQASTQRLYEHLPKGIGKLVVISDAAHNTISRSSDYISELRASP